VRYGQEKPRNFLGWAFMVHLRHSARIKAAEGKQPSRTQRVTASAQELCTLANLAGTAAEGVRANPSFTSGKEMHDRQKVADGSSGRSHTKNRQPSHAFASQPCRKSQRNSRRKAAEGQDHQYLHDGHYGAWIGPARSGVRASARGFDDHC